MHPRGTSLQKLSRSLSLTRTNKMVGVLLGAILLVLLANPIYSASIYNSDFKAQRVEIESKDGTHYFVTVYNSSTEYFDCPYGCQVKLVNTGYTKTLEADAVVIIDDGKLRVK